MNRASVFLGRMKKRLHPLSIRKWLHFLSARKDKQVRVTPKLSLYINDLLAGSEEGKVAEQLANHEKHPRSYLHVPYSQGRFIETFAKAVGAKKILEIGTFQGYSTYFLARSLGQGGKVVTIDEDARYEQDALNFWRSVQVDDKITFRLGMADKLLKEMVLDPALLGSFDLVFIDADKENYVIYAEYALKLLKSGGSLLVDNTLWKGLVAYPKPHDNGAMHVHQFNQWIMETYGNSCSIIPAWDGLSIVVKK